MARILCLAALLAALLAPAAQAGGPAATVRDARPADEQGRRRLRRLRGRPRHGPDAVLARARRGAHAGLGQQALHDLGGARALRRRGPADDRGARRRGASTTTGVVAGNLYLRGGGDPSFSRAEARGLARVLAGSGLTARRRARDRRRVALRQRARRPGLQLRRLLVGRPAQRPAVQPRLHDRQARRASSASPPLYAAQRFERELERAGVSVRRAGARRGRARTAAVLLGEWASPRMSVLVKQHQPAVRQLHGRDAAEGARGRLRRRRDDRGGRGGRAQPRGRSTAREPTMVDGSGLSRAEPARRRATSSSCWPAWTRASWPSRC